MCPFPEIQLCAAVPGLIWAHLGPITLICFSSSSFSFCFCVSLRLGAPPLSRVLLTDPLLSRPEAWTLFRRAKESGLFWSVDWSSPHTLPAPRPANTWTEVRSRPPGPPLSWPGYSSLWERVKISFHVLSPWLCRWGEVCSPSEEVGWGRGNTPLPLPKQGPLGKPTRKRQETTRGTLTLGICQPVCTFVDCKHCVCRLVFFYVRWEFGLSQAFFLCLTNWLKNSTSWGWRGHNHVTQTGETGEAGEAEVAQAHPHLSAGFVLNEGTLFLKVDKRVLQINFHVNPGAQAGST